jgi:hypothetical protein
MTKINQLQRTLKAVSKLQPIEIISPLDLRKLCSKIIINKNGCWEWQGARNEKGYGTVFYNSKPFMCHRLMFKLFKDELKNLIVCHHCDNPCCCNPSHLFLGTHKENINDCINKGRSKVFEKKHIAHNAKLSKKEAGKIVEFLAMNPETGSRQLADKFKIPMSIAKDIKRGRSYGNLIEHFECLNWD